MTAKPLSRWRYLAPNLVTTIGIVFGLLSLEASVSGQPRTAAWWVLWAVLTDKLDGAVARRLKATSEFGVQLDSLSDFLCFGVAPATLFYSFLSNRPELGWSSGVSLFALRAISILYGACAAVRLARFNIITEVQGSDRIFFGVPTTFAGGALCALFATFLKYGDPAWLADDAAGFDLRLLGGLRLDGGMKIFPLLVLFHAVMMVSALRVPKIGRSRKLYIDVWVFGNIAFAYTVGWLRILPEWLAFGAFTYGLGSLIYHFVAPTRNVKLPPIFGD